MILKQFVISVLSVNTYKIETSAIAMKRYKPNYINPRTNQFYEFIKGKISELGQKSAAYLAVLHLFSISESLYSALASCTAENLAIFTESEKYLTAEQEHDVIALTAHYVSSINCDTIHTIVLADKTISEEDRSILKGAVELYKTIAQTSTAALGYPRWV